MYHQSDEERTTLIFFGETSERCSLFHDDFLMASSLAQFLIGRLYQLHEDQHIAS